MALFVGSLSCCVSPPTPQEVLDTGFRTPEMTFRSFQVGVRGDLPRLEFACFSTGFRAQYGMSQLSYREIRETRLKSEIAYWLGIPDAEILETVALASDRVLLKLESHGTEFELGMVREDFWQLWQGGRLLADEPLARGSFREQADVSSEEGQLTMITGFALIPAYLNLPPADELNRNFTEFRIGREWKIDHIGGAEDALAP